MIVEAAVESVDAALAAERAGVDRIELCRDLSIGGVTPEHAITLAVVERVTIPVHLMIRPRGGDFVYSRAEVDRMVDEIAFARSANVAGIVTGALTGDNAIDVVTMQTLIAAAGPLAVTFHRAFDAIASEAALEELIDLGVARVLTSGGGSTAIAGAKVIADLVRAAGEQIVIAAGGSVRAHNVRALIALTGVREVHARFIEEQQMRDLVLAARRV